MLHLRNHAVSCRIAPELGGAVYALDYLLGSEKQPLLRPTWGEAAHLITDYANWPLVPFSNRIKHGKFSFLGKDYRVPINYLGYPHASHGQAWERPWHVAAQTEDHCKLTFAFADAALWPFPYAATQEFRLLPNGLEHSLSLTNTGATPMPAGLGLHPYFPKTPGTTLQAAVAGLWEIDAETIPTRRVAVPPEYQFAATRPLDAARLDHCFDGYGGFMEIVWPQRPMKLQIQSSPSLKYLVVYTPQGKDFFCAEPVSHMPDAINRWETHETGLVVLAPGETMTAQYQFAAVPV